MFSFLRRKERPNDPPNVRLMKTMKFGGKDLTANRGGILTEAQRKKIQRGQMWGAVGWWFMAIFMAVPVIFIAKEPDSQIGVLFLTLFALMFVGLAFWQQSKTRKVLEQNQTAAVSGVVSRRVDMVYTGKVFIPVHKVIVDDKTFTVDSRVHDSFIEGEDYTLYYIPETDQLLSAELTYSPEKEKRLSDEDEDIQSVEELEDELQAQQDAY
jgi:hypothetical protein